jgi:hypothetical protein
LRLNFYVATALTLVGIAWFIRAQRRPDRPGLTAANAESADDNAVAPEADGAVAPGGGQDR